MRYIGGHERPEPTRAMSRKFREMIVKAAAQADAQITAVNRGEYRPKIEVVTQGDNTALIREPVRAST
jgi:hypothetical protein